MKHKPSLMLALICFTMGGAAFAQALPAGVEPGDATVSAPDLVDAPNHPELPPLPKQISVLTDSESKPTKGWTTTHKDSYKFTGYAFIPGDTKAEKPPQKTDAEEALQHNNRGVTLGAKKDWEAAIPEHILAASGQPKNKAFATNLSSVEMQYAQDLEKQGKPNEAIQHFRAALYVDEQNIPARDGLDRCLQSEGLDTKSFDARLKLAQKAEEDGNLETAIVEYNIALRLKNSRPERAKLAMCLLKAGKQVPAFRELEQAIQYKGAPFDDRSMLSSYKKLGEILQHYADVANASHHYALARIRLENGWIYYRHAFEVDPTDAECKRELLDIATKAVDIEPKFANCIALGSAQLINGDIENAAQTYDKCATAKDADAVLLKQARAAIQVARAHKSK